MTMPMASHITRRYHVTLFKLAISPRDTTMPSIGTNGTMGVLNGLGKSGRRLRRIMTAPQTMTNASSVPMLTICPKLPIGTSEPNTAAPKPVTAVAFHGVFPDVDLYEKVSWASADSWTPSVT